MAACCCISSSVCALLCRNSTCRSWLILSKPMVWMFTSLVKYAMFASLDAITPTPAPGNVTLLVEANSYTMSPLPYLAHSASM